MATLEKPVIFLGHGSPDTILENNSQYKKDLLKLKNIVNTSKGIIFISAHWYDDKLQITSSNNPTIIYDFYGFPEELYNIKVNLISNKQTSIKISKDLNINTNENRGFDHGVWTLAKIIEIDSNIPIYQISIKDQSSPTEYFNFAKKLLKYRSQGYTIICSGNIIHNFNYLQRDKNSKPSNTFLEFEKKIKKLLTEKNFTYLINIQKMENSQMIIPELSHYIPFIYFLGLIKPSEQIKIIHESFQHGSISMLSLISQ